MFTGVKLGQTIKFIHPQDPDKDNPTIFHIGVLDAAIRSHIEDETVELADDDHGAVKVRVLYAQRNVMFVKYGLVKIENFGDPVTGNRITVDAADKNIAGGSYKAMTDDVINQLAALGLISSLAIEISKINRLSGEEEKN